MNPGNVTDQLRPALGPLLLLLAFSLFFFLAEPSAALLSV